VTRTDLAPLAQVVARRADAAVLIGESAPLLARLFAEAGVARIERAATLEAAVVLADAIARERLRALGDRGLALRDPATVLLSPAAASFDMFVDYAARGRAFKTAVASLAERHGAPAGEEHG
jgi:UDP-N-acetylmuramoylalanine--D-glutamate ligase